MQCWRGMCGVRLVEQELCGANKINLATSRQHHRRQRPL